jgi:hypothetical protein
MEFVDSLHDSLCPLKLASMMRSVMGLPFGIPKRSSALLHVHGGEDRAHQSDHCYPRSRKMRAIIMKQESPADVRATERIVMNENRYDHD